MVFVVLAIHIQTSLADEETKIKYDTPKNRAALGLNEDWMPDSENNMQRALRLTEIQKIARQADSEYEVGNYQDALDLLKGVEDSQVGPVRLYYQVKAKCLAHLKQEQGAIAAAEQADDQTRREVYQLLGLRVASASPINGLSPAHRLLVQIELLVTHGKKQEARNLAERMWWKELREGCSAEDWNAELKQLGLDGLTPPPHGIELNPEVFEALSMLIGLPQPNTKADMQALFHRDFVVEEKFPGNKYPSFQGSGSNALTNVNLYRDLPRSENLLAFAFDLDHSWIEESEIRKFLAKHGITAITSQPPVISTIEHGGYVPDTSGPTLTFTDNGATIELPFEKIGQLCGALKYWPKPADERAYLEQRSQPPDPRVELENAQQLITTKQYEKALAILIPHYVFHDGSFGTTMQSRYDAMRSTRTLLVQCYDGLGKHDVARYLTEAPLKHIWEHALYGRNDPNTCFPTYSEYMARPWNVFGMTKSDSDGEYQIRVNNLLQCDFYSCSPRFKKVFSILGPIYNETKRLPPLPGSLVDEELISPCFRH